MPTGSEIIAASSQHPDIGQAAAEVVGAVSDRQPVAPSLILLALAGRHVDEMMAVANAIHSLLQSEQTVAFGAPALACGGRLLDPSGSLALLSVTETEVGVDTTRTVTPPAGAVCLGDPGRIVLGPMRLATSSSGNAVVTIDSRPSGHLLRVLDGDRRETVSRLEVTLAGVGARLTTSNGASPVGMPATITSTDGRRVLTMDGVRPRSVIVECLELDDQDAAGPSLDLPPLMLKILDANRDHPLVPVVGADPADGSLISDRPIELGSLVQLLRHDPLAAVRDVVSRQLGRRGPPPQAALVTSQLPAGPTDQLISDAAGLLGLDLFGTIGPSRPSPGAWSTASLLTLSPRGP